MDHGASAVEQLAGTGRVARHQRLSVFGQYEDSARADASAVPGSHGSVTAPDLCRLHRRGGRFGVTPTGSDAMPAGLPSPMFPAGAPRGGGESVSRFVLAPEGVCSHAFQSGLLRKYSPVGVLACGKRSHQKGAFL
ncbi:hypothetical protein GCM10010449_83420 [Streptomyces rectiviolaceus]|uniref:Uncharacterized protein n=1 Tax=Streptomyces rectiviolaceus TaxID=332591 RepID=A0ABP6NLX5_9ACTN